MQRSKVETYLGFCKRAGRLTLGVNAAATLKKAELLVADKDVAQNSWKEILKLKTKFSCPLLLVEGLENIVHKEHCKLAAVQDKNLAEAIYREVENGQIIEYIGGQEK